MAVTQLSEVKATRSFAHLPKSTATTRLRQIVDGIQFIV